MSTDDFVQLGLLSFAIAAIVFEWVILPMFTERGAYFHRDRRLNRKARRAINQKHKRYRQFLQLKQEFEHD